MDKERGGLHPEDAWAYLEAMYGITADACREVALLPHVLALTREPLFTYKSGGGGVNILMTGKVAYLIGAVRGRKNEFVAFPPKSHPGMVPGITLTWEMRETHEKDPPEGDWWTKQEGYLIHASGFGEAFLPLLESKGGSRYNGDRFQCFGLPCEYPRRAYVSNHPLSPVWEVHFFNGVEDFLPQQEAQVGTLVEKVLNLTDIKIR